jgi:hypothetical protein
MKLTEKLSKQAFWDNDMQTIDAEKHAAFIITKVFEFGTLSDVREVIAHYGRKTVLEALLHQPFLHSDTLNFASSLFKVPKETFGCYTKTQLQKNAGLSFKS